MLCNVIDSEQLQYIFTIFQSILKQGHYLHVLMSMQQTQKTPTMQMVCVLILILTSILGILYVLLIINGFCFLEATIRKSCDRMTPGLMSPPTPPHQICTPTSRNVNTCTSVSPATPNNFKELICNNIMFVTFIFECVHITLIFICSACHQANVCRYRNGGKHQNVAAADCCWYFEQQLSRKYRHPNELSKSRR